MSDVVLFFNNSVRRTLSSEEMEHSVEFQGLKKPSGESDQLCLATPTCIEIKVDEGGGPVINSAWN